MSRLLAPAAALILAGVVVGGMLLTNVHGDSGRGEIDLTSIHEITVGTGDVITQPVLIQRAAPEAIELPYRWKAAEPASLNAQVMTSSGSLISDTTLTLSDSTTPLWLQPIGDGSFWEREAAEFHPIKLPANATGWVVLRLTRTDQQPGTLVLFASAAMATPSTQQPGSMADPRPPIVERPADVLELVTVYGPTGPAWAKLSTFASRIQLLAPPWLPFPVPEFLLVCAIAAVAFLVWVMPRAPVEAPGSDVSQTRSR